MRVIHLQDKNKKDRCVVCGALTEYTRDTPISERFGYIEGVGQLCRKCFAELYENGLKSFSRFVSDE